MGSAGTFDDLIDRYSVASLRVDPAQVPPTLYHYTDAAGLIGMLSSGKIWATDHRFLNDKTELQHTRSLLDKILTTRMRNSPSDIISKLYASILDLQRKPPVETEIFLFSLSEDGDSLSQWRGYARDGQGFTIGFSGVDLANQCAGDAEHGFSKIEYNQENQERGLQLALEAIEKLLVQRVAIPSSDADFEIGDAAASFDTIVWNRSVINKHESFSSEKEWRLYSFVEGYIPQEEKVRARGLSLVPYLECQLKDSAGMDRLPITRVGVGPGFTGTEEAVAVKTLLRRYKYDVEVYYANTPYRRT